VIDPPSVPNAGQTHRPPDLYVDHIGTAIRALIEDGRTAAELQLAAIAYTPREIEARSAVPMRVVAQVFKRDKFCCRYCGQRTIITPIMELLGGLFPDLFPFHPNWKGGATHPAIMLISPVVDHLNPGAWSGAWSDLDNLRTSCWPCNQRKGDLTLEQLSWQELAIAHADWDGLTNSYVALWTFAGCPKPTYHKRWITAFDLSRGVAINGGG
jgi:hypothetical protein